MNNAMIYHRNFNNGQVQPALFPMPDMTPGYRKDNPLEKRDNGLNIGVTPGAVIGAAVGGAVAKKGMDSVMAEQATQAAIAEKNKANVSGSYYSQVSNIINNLNVVFTPISAIFMIKNKGTDFTLDTVEVSEMNDHMAMAFKQRDEEYFKDIFKAKMYTEMQVAEQEFARRLFKKQMATKDMILKQASDLDDIDSSMYFSFVDDFKSLASAFENHLEFAKIASAIVEDVANEFGDVKISTTLDRPFNKYAGVLTGLKSTLGLSTPADQLNAMKEKFSDASYTIKHVQVGFLPDRVIFSLGNQLIGTLPLTEMNDDGYEKFLSQDQKYFRNFFSDYVKETSLKTSAPIMKTASETLPERYSIQDCLKSSDTHPVLLYLFLTDRFGLEWLQFDIAAIEDIIKTEVEIDDFSEANKNKVMAIMMANQSDTPFVNAYAFEKAVLSLCGKPVDFLSKEKSAIDIQDIIFAIDVLDRVTPYDDIYDNFSLEVFNYMADVLTGKGMYLYEPTNIIMSELEPIFIARLNEIIAQAMQMKMTLFTTGEEEDRHVRKQCAYISDTSSLLLKNIRRNITNSTDIAGRIAIIEQAILDLNVDISVKKIVTEQVTKNLALDDILLMFEENLQSQLMNYNLHAPKGDEVSE